MVNLIKIEIDFVFVARPSQKGKSDNQAKTKKKIEIDFLERKKPYQATTMTTELTFEHFMGLTIEDAMAIGSEPTDDWIQLEPLFADVGKLVPCVCCGKMVYDDDEDTYVEKIWKSTYYLGRVTGKTLDRIEYSCDYNTCYKIHSTEKLIQYFRGQRVSMERALGPLVRDFKKAMERCRKYDLEIDHSTLSTINSLRFWIKYADAIINGERDLEKLEYMRLKLMGQLGEAIEDNHEDTGLMDMLLLFRCQVEDEDLTHLYVSVQ